MKKNVVSYWISGLCIGLAVCAVFGCPAGVMSIPIMVVLAVVFGYLGYRWSKATS